MYNLHSFTALWINKNHILKRWKLAKLIKYQSKRIDSHLKTSRLNHLHPQWLLSALRIKSKCLSMVKGLRSDHCSFFLCLCPPRFIDQPPWPSFTTCPSAWWAVPIFFIEQVSVWLAPSHLWDASPSGFPLRDAFSGDFLLSCIVWLCDIVFLICTPLECFLPLDLFPCLHWTASTWKAGSLTSDFLWKP